MPQSVPWPLRYRPTGIQEETGRGTAVEMMTAERIVAWLGGGDDIRAWVDGLAAGEPDGPVILPAGALLVEALLRLTVAHEDIDPLLALRPSPERDPEVWWLLERSVGMLRRRMGAVAPWATIPPLPEAVGPLRRWFWVYVFAAALPDVRAYHAARGIPEDVSWATLADLGRQMAVHRKRHGESGLDDPVWVTLHFTGALYQLGRLQFERIRLGDTGGRAFRQAGSPAGPGDPALSIHIPGYSGPFSPAACDAALAAALPFFARHLPEERYEVGACWSWLLDDQLPDHLPETSNIVRFQRRFTLVPPRPDDRDNGLTLRFVFGLDPEQPLDAFPQRTSLERAVIAHIQAGQHWRPGAGWLRLPGATALDPPGAPATAAGETSR